MASLRKWKWCEKIVKETPDAAALVQCSNSPKCGDRIHQACFLDLLSKNDETEGVCAAACGKRRFNAVLKALKAADNPVSTSKKRVAWHNDGPTPSISSVSCLIDWMTTSSKHSRYRGGDAQSGETKSTIAGEVVRFISSCGVTTYRTAKDIQSKISSLEQSFKTAADWLGATGQGVQDEKCLRDAILSRCPYYYDLYDIMNDRGSTTPLMLNTDAIDVSEESSTDDDSDDGSTSNEGDVSSIEGVTTEPTGINSDAVVPRENASAIETQARIAESTARKHHFEAQAESCELQRKVALLRERHKLRQEGVPPHEIEALLPIRIPDLE
ncbi:serine/threonine-protein kinase drkC [Phytophthora nicotianae]|uniref:Serine/threonine-protein kinase drkC n=1 Tax=Phytophthora nicotianae TaxID=4792 RepID=A0A0W8CYG7_PHYNI|nr:serine/threonine-protein kinase drkC [Phytophthora nicotianae]